MKNDQNEEEKTPVFCLTDYITNTFDVKSKLSQGQKIIPIIYKMTEIKENEENNENLQEISKNENSPENKRRVQKKKEIFIIKPWKSYDNLLTDIRDIVFFIH